MGFKLLNLDEDRYNLKKCLMGKFDLNFKKSFEKDLIRHGLSIHFTEDNIYQLIPNKGDSKIVTVQFIGSEPTNMMKHGSRNGNTIQSIGRFQFGLHPEEKKPDFYIFAFSTDNLVDYIILPIEEMERRLLSRNQISIDNDDIEMVFWLLPDRYLFETTHIGIEGEWYFISKGVNGRMADDTDMDYTTFLNDWGQL